MNYPHAAGGDAKAKRLWLVAIPLVLILVFAGAVVFRVHRALTRASQTISSQDKLAFTLRTLDTQHTSNATSELLGSQPHYTSGAFLAGNLYLTGPTGLSIVAADGTSRLALRTGFELPVSPIVNAASGHLRGTSGPQLLFATSGAGLLLLETNADGAPTLRQLLPDNPEARDLTSIAALPTGDLLLGTRNHGVLLYNGNSLVPLRFSLPAINPSSLQITALAAIDASSFLIGTRNAGVFYSHAGTVEQITTASGLPDNEIESIVLSPKSLHSFVGTPVGTAELDLSAQPVRALRTLGKGLFSHTLAVDDQQLFIGTLDQGIQPIPLDNRPHLHNISLSLGSAATVPQRIDALLAAPGSLYALSDGQLLRNSDNGWTIALTATSPALTDRNISALAFAPDGTLYIGYFDHGIDLLSSKGSIRHLEDDHLFCINRLALDPARQTIAAATADGLVLFDSHGTPRQTLMRRDGLISDHVTDVAFTNSGTVLATPAGITFLGPAGAESLYAFQGLVNNHVYALASSGQLLAGTLGGLSILNGGKIQRNLTVSNSALKHNWITALLPLPDHKFLVGTYGAGLTTLDSQDHFSSIELPANTPRNLVINPNALFATATHLYAGTLGHGMLVYSNTTGRWSAINAGLPSLNVTAFAARDGQVYIGTENGLVRMAEANLP
ncbi:ligand-binding sensor domain-containing protein [Granulicella paludicola]|uniref:ligand-binding sensor domain-containing protein n=1 Tax=Granulicella paludicola TaxID=474951 RepID=UPI0021E07217|nr:hypothetical protein [Granulicella paludicola]